MIKRWLYALITIVFLLCGRSLVTAQDYYDAVSRADTTVVATDSLDIVTASDSVIAPVSKADTVPSIKGDKAAFFGSGIQDSVADASLDTGRSLWEIVLAAVLWGVIAFFMLSLYPIIPSTISSLIKEKNNNKQRGFISLLFGSSIIALYTLPVLLLILIIYIVCGDSGIISIFSWLATHWFSNILFFILFILFAVSFFGAFEFTIPAATLKRVEEKSNNGGVPSLFFKVLLLMLVSFSSTGPIVVTIFIRSMHGAIWEPIITMFAFSAAFALPFMFFVFAPSLMGSLPKSGSWSQSLKVLLGFTEIFFAIKFLSVADQVYGWGVLDREVYLALLIVILMLLGLSFLGKIRFKGSSHANQITVPRLIISIAIFSFAAYLVPGMWGAPLKAVSGYLPQVNTQDFRLMWSDSAMGESMSGYYDYSQALERSEKVGKPVFLYFTGKACIDCRKMEAKVFSDARVQKILRERYLLLVMYADVRYDLREDNWVITPNGKILKSVGKINTNILITKYGVTEMPCCLLLDSKGNTILPPRGYDLNINAFIKYLERGLK